MSQKPDPIARLHPHQSGGRILNVAKMSSARSGHRFFRRAIGLLGLGLVAFLTGPLVIHFAYRLGTFQKEREEKTRRYQLLANSELGTKEVAARRRSEAERVELFYWFHSRGWPIDEGHEGSSTFDDWRELVRYWMQNEKSLTRRERPPRQAGVAQLIPWGEAIA